MGETSWAFLLVGTFAAVGAAMAFGTLAALVRYHRTGVFPGADPASSDADVTTWQYAALWVRIAVGAALAAAGAVALVRSGLL